MESLFSIKDLSQSDRIFICFALAKAYENLGKQEELFKVLHEGNQLRKKELKYSIEKSKNHNSIIKKLFNSSPKPLSSMFKLVRVWLQHRPCAREYAPSAPIWFVPKSKHRNAGKPPFTLPEDYA